MEWKQYYWRIIGYFLLGGGTGLVVDELIHGPFQIGIGDHEVWGIVIAIVGCIFIAKKPHEK